MKLRTQFISQLTFSHFIRQSILERENLDKQTLKMKFESKIAAFLDTHLLFTWDAETKQLIGCKWVMKTVGNSGLLVLEPTLYIF